VTLSGGNVSLARFADLVRDAPAPRLSGRG
jgi:hypothetical protein